MKTEKSSESSEFAKMLRGMLDAHSRSEWAEILNVTESAISQWLGDDTFPRPESLRRIVRALEENVDVPDRVLEEFESLARKPLKQISRHGERTERTLAHYMVKPLRDAFLRVIDTLPPEAQEEVLLEAASLARQKRSRGGLRQTVAERRALMREVTPRATGRDDREESARAPEALQDFDFQALTVGMLPQEREKVMVLVLERLLSAFEPRPAIARQASPRVQSAMMTFARGLLEETSGPDERLSVSPHV